LPRAEDVAIAEAHVAEMQSAYDVAVARRAQAQLVAPLDGTVLSVKAHASEFVPTGGTVITIADLDQLQVRMTGVLELEVAQFEAGDTVALSFEMLPDEEYEGTIAYMTPGTDPYGNVAFTVLIDLPDAPDGLMLGSTAYVRMKAQS
ncbi:MAG TPA: efflux RND transporter periplasmic adaptor subunit, partial [Aggregatilineales bacterium]|nr:efflux RND transporter periplasmic adaptor subunit [Aggregatilineales bacterium]